MNRAVKDVGKGMILGMIGLVMMIGGLYLGKTSALGALAAVGIGFMVILAAYKVAKGPKEVRLVS
jgi:hypothetical protein